MTLRAIMQRVPSPDYLAAVSQASTILSNPSASRKLLVLDLNGTLLLRSKKAHSNQRDGNSTRAIHPRPFMKPFCQYLAHPSTQSWLDTMVWSSARPENVGYMVDACFGQYKPLLSGIWARDKIGLSKKDYNAKSQTTKDLTKPLFEIFLSNMKPIPSLKLVHTCSAYSTLLLDDSPAKAVLQPLNHLCIPEYTSTQFASDTEHARLLRGVSQDKRLQRLRNQIEEQRQTPAPDTQTPEDEAKARKLAKGKAKKLAKLEERLKACNINLDGPAPGAQFDETLLAVVGVLDTVRWQSNVSSWIKDGGLLGRPSDDQVALGDRSPPAAEQAPSEHNLWFDDPEVFRLWVQKGRDTLTGLHIHLGAGVP